MEAQSHYQCNIARFIMHIHFSSNFFLGKINNQSYTRSLASTNYPSTFNDKVLSTDMLQGKWFLE